MTLNLTAKKREVLGKKVKNLRAEGFIPAELYGHNVKNIHVSVPETEFIKVFRNAGEHAIIDLVIDDGKKIPVLVSDVHYDTLSEKFLAVDFHQVKMDEKINAQIPVVLKGEAPATKAGCILLHTLHEIPVECLPGNIPNEFEIDISSIKSAGDAISVGSIKTDDEVKMLLQPETVIITAQEKKVRKEEDEETTSEATPEEETKEEVKEGEEPEKK